MAKRPLPESAFVTDLDGAIIIPEVDDAVEEARWRDRVAKMARDWAVPLSKEGDACGWSSAVLERDLAMRRRRGPASSSRRGRGLVVGEAAAASADERICRGKESTPSGPVAAKAALQTEIDIEFLVHFYLNVL
ncbi:hypothetical protein PR202_gn00062 [Eleusine coracana subsp. coracana]|uniref:Uncharacterized protein n=1 Tax=Eleusine coracana subsp. coracana TaxID=191504 RepID=A0AAV5FYM0_ELECO|nr:hypothetical protein PR202_gb20063 [Eleusine coracana subsp. coracana]GJN40764.1 hypothetical protein PR202_gn00062 [Eleusine coracana subsp. coracana]